MLSGLSDWVVDVIDRLGYVGVALLVALENLFPPIPSEIVLPFAGFVARDGGATLPGMILAATIGSIVGRLDAVRPGGLDRPRAPRAVPAALRQVAAPDPGRRRQGRALVRPAGGRGGPRRALRPADPLARVDPGRVPAHELRRLHAVHAHRLGHLEHGADRRRLRAARQLARRRADPQRRPVRRHRARSWQRSGGCCGPGCSPRRRRPPARRRRADHHPARPGQRQTRIERSTAPRSTFALCSAAMPLTETWACSASASRRQRPST